MIKEASQCGIANGLSVIYAPQPFCLRGVCLWLCLFKIFQVTPPHIHINLYLICYIWLYLGETQSTPLTGGGWTSNSLVGKWSSNSIQSQNKQLILIFMFKIIIFPRHLADPPGTPSGSRGPPFQSRCIRAQVDCKYISCCLPDCIVNIVKVLVMIQMASLASSPGVLWVVGLSRAYSDTLRSAVVFPSSMAAAAPAVVRRCPCPSRPLPVAAPVRRCPCPSLPLSVAAPVRRYLCRRCLCPPLPLSVAAPVRRCPCPSLPLPSLPLPAAAPVRRCPCPSLPLSVVTSAVAASARCCPCPSLPLSVAASAIADSRRPRVS